MNTYLKRGLMALGFATTAVVSGVLADVTITEGTDKVIFAFTCFTNKVCPAAVTVNNAGTEIFTTANPASVTGANGTFPATQSGTWTVQPGNTANSTAWLVTGTGGVFPATQSGTWNIATMTTLTGITNPVTVVGPGATGAALSGNPVRIAMSDGTNTQNWLSALAQVDGVNGNNMGSVGGYVWNGTTWDRMPGTTAGVTVRSPTAGNFNITCANCSGSGVSAVDEATFAAGMDLLAPTGGFYQTTATANALTSGHQGMWQMTAQRAGFVNLRNASGTEIGTATTPLDVVAVGLASTGVTTSTATGSLVMGAATTAAPTYTTGNTYPLSLQTDGSLRVAVTAGGTGGGAVTLASGAVSSGAYSSGSFASGAFASGSHASGSFASGAFASGSVASGAYASGSIPDLGAPTASTGCGATDNVRTCLGAINTNIQAGASATGAAPPADGIYAMGLGSGATGGLTRANIICDQHAIYTGTDIGSKTLVAGVSGRLTYICGWLLTTGSSATVLTLFKGTDADCATSGAAIGPPYALLGNDKVGVNSSYWNGFRTGTTADYVCINAGAANQHTAEIWYAIL